MTPGWDHHMGLPLMHLSHNIYCKNKRITSVEITSKCNIFRSTLSTLGRPQTTGCCSGRENYFWRPGQNVRQAISALPDILSPCQTFFPVDDWQISVAILVFLVGHLMCIEPCWTICPEGSDLSAGHHQKSAGHVRHVRHISRSLCWTCKEVAQE